MIDSVYVHVDLLEHQAVVFERGYVVLFASNRLQLQSL